MDSHQDEAASLRLADHTIRPDPPLAGGSADVQRRDEALAELTKAKKLLDKMPAKSAADRRQPVELTVAELRKLVEACEAQIRQAEQ